MAPEQIGGARDVDARADVWALGVTFYMLVTGGPPFDGADVFELFGQIPTRPAPALRSVTGPAIAGVIDRCLAKDPGGRPRDASELGAELARARSAAPAVQASLTATLDGASGPPPRTAIMAPLRSASSAPITRAVSFARRPGCQPSTSAQHAARALA